MDNNKINTVVGEVNERGLHGVLEEKCAETFEETHRTLKTLNRVVTVECRVIIGDQRYHRRTTVHIVNQCSRALQEQP